MKTQTYKKCFFIKRALTSLLTPGRYKRLKLYTVEYTATIMYEISVSASIRLPVSVVEIKKVP